MDIIKKELTSYHKNLVGIKYGDLTVLEFVGYSTRSRNPTMWLCECSCKTQLIVCKVELVSGDTKFCEECGLNKRRLNPGDAAWNKLYMGYKWGAKNRNFIFDLSIEEFKDICSKNCHYCNASPELKQIIADKKQREEWAEKCKIKTNGIDRFNSNYGYIKGNCLPCCSLCNIMKSNMNVCKFLLHIQKIASHSRNKYE